MAEEMNTEGAENNIPNNEEGNKSEATSNQNNNQNEEENKKNADEEKKRQEEKQRQNKMVEEMLKTWNEFVSLVKDAFGSKEKQENSEKLNINSLKEKFNELKKQMETLKAQYSQNITNDGPATSDKKNDLSPTTTNIQNTQTAIANQNKQSEKELLYFKGNGSADINKTDGKITDVTLKTKGDYKKHTRTTKTIDIDKLHKWKESGKINDTQFNTMKQAMGEKQPINVTKDSKIEYNTALVGRDTKTKTSEYKFDNETLFSKEQKKDVGGTSMFNNSTEKRTEIKKGDEVIYTKVQNNITKNGNVKSYNNADNVTIKKRSTQKQKPTLVAAQGIKISGSQNGLFGGNGSVTICKANSVNSNVQTNNTVKINTIQR